MARRKNRNPTLTELSAESAINSGESLSRDADISRPIELQSGDVSKGNSEDDQSGGEKASAAVENDVTPAKKSSEVTESMCDVTDEETLALIQQLMLEDKAVDQEKHNEWTTAKYKNRNRKHTEPSPEFYINSSVSKAEIADVSSGYGSKRVSEDDESGEASSMDNDTPEKKKKNKKKKSKVTVVEAASKIDYGDLGALLVDISMRYESKEDVQLMRFADHFGEAFASVSGSQFPWIKTFKESNVAKLVDIPLSHISSDIYKMSTDWIGKRSFDVLVPFGELLLDRIIADLENHQGDSKGSKKTAARQGSSKSQVATFVVLAMVLRQKPDVLIGLVPAMTRTLNRQEQEKLPLIVWLTTQASVGDLAVGLYMWSRFLLPTLGSKPTRNPQSRDLILQLVERILFAPKAPQILLNNHSKMGNRLVPPSSLDILMRLTFPAASDRVKATERFEAIYPLLKEVALTGSPGSKAMKRLAKQIFDFAIKAAKENVDELSKESSHVFFWCLKQNQKCYKKWNAIYLENLKASVPLLRRLSSERKAHDELKLLKDTFKRFKEKTNAELAEEHSKARRELLQDANKYIDLILSRSSNIHGCLKSVVLVFLVTVAAGTATFISQTKQS